MKDICIFVFTVLLLLGCSPRNEPQQEPPTMSVPVAKPLVKKIIDWDEYTGRFHAISRVEVRARVGGYVEEIKFQDGQIVKEGDVLFVIDKRPFQFRVDSAQSELKSAELEVQLAQIEFNRVQRLRKTLAASKEEYEQKNFALYRARAKVESAKATLALGKLNLTLTEVKAPISGRVGRDLINAGNLISGGDSQATLLTTIVSLDPIHFYFEANEAQLLKYIRLNKSGQRKASRDKANPIKVKLLDEEKFVHRGQMDFVDNAIDLQTGTMQGRAIFPNRDGIIQPGMFGRAQLVGSGKYEAILIPDKLIVTDQSNKFVYVVSKDNEIQRRYITLGPLHQKTMRVIRKGLDKDDTVVIGHVQKIYSGMKVNPVVKAIGDNDEV